MTSAPFYSDRTTGGRARDLEHLPEETWRGLVALVDIKISSNWLAQQFSEPCPDGNGVAGTDRQNLHDTLHALVPELDWPPPRYDVPDTSVAFDLVDFVAQRIAKPKDGQYHSFFKHHELLFDIPAGQAAFRAEVDQLFARGGVAFEVGPDMRVVRMGPPEARQVIADLRPDTGDTKLDELIVDARTRYLSRHPAEERVGLEKLWDAFERLKTIEPGKDKKAKVTALLDKVASGAMRDTFEQESRALTDIGNQMQIRHFETGKHALVDGEVDYLFMRMATFVVHVLRETGRLKN